MRFGWSESEGVKMTSTNTNQLPTTMGEIARVAAKALDFNALLTGVHVLCADGTEMPMSREAVAIWRDKN